MIMKPSRGKQSVPKSNCGTKYMVHWLKIMKPKGISLFTVHKPYSEKRK